jgi:hypothetical protein
MRLVDLDFTMNVISRVRRVAKRILGRGGRRAVLKMASRAYPSLKGAGRAYFSVMRPHTTVLPHCGPQNTRIRCHLPLQVPPDCGMRVGGEDVAWQEGRCTIFDDSLVHEVWNKSDRERVVLLFDFWHPELTPAERNAVRGLGWATGFRSDFTRVAYESQQLMVAKVMARRSAQID